MKKKRERTSASLEIHALELTVNLGVTKKERSKKQNVLLSIKITYKNTPKAVSSDAIRDALCYKDLTQRIHAVLLRKEFQLVEHLAHEIHAMIKTITAKNANVLVTVTKFPKIAGLMGGICFNYGDVN